MEHNLNPCHTHLLNSNSYVASSGCKNFVAWYMEKVGHVLIEPDTKKNAVLAIVGKVLENCLDCNRHGNFRKQNFQSGCKTMDKAKYQVMLGKPDNTPFADNFNIAVDTLATLQDKIAHGPDCKNLIIKEQQVRMLCFMRGIFK